MTDPSSPGAQLARRHPRWFRAGRALDRMLNVVLLSGSEDETISHNAAVRRAEGARWACVLCRVLDVLVERDHCSKTLNPAEIELPAALRAGAALLALLGLLIWAGHMLPRWLF